MVNKPSQHKPFSFPFFHLFYAKPIICKLSVLFIHSPETKAIPTSNTIFLHNIPMHHIRLQSLWVDYLKSLTVKV